MVEKENSNYCASCGSKLTESTNYCENCGEYISNTDSEPDSTFKHSLKNYIGKNDEFYFKKWNLNENGEPSKRVSTNWAGFFLTFMWAGYRKMYGTLFIMFGAFLVLDIIMLLIDTDSIQINNSIGIVISVMFLLNGNLLYYEKAKKQINKNKSLSPEEATAELKKNGGTSKLGVLFAIGMFILYLIVSVFIIEPEFGNTDSEFGKDSADNMIREANEKFEPEEEIHFAYIFDEQEGGAYKIVVEDDDSTEVFDEWESEAPQDWPGAIEIMNAPSDEGAYRVKLVEEGDVTSEGTFTVVK